MRFLSLLLLSATLTFSAAAQSESAPVPDTDAPDSAVIPSTTVQETPPPFDNGRSGTTATPTKKRTSTTVLNNGRNPDAQPSGASGVKTSAVPTELNNGRNSSTEATPSRVRPLGVPKAVSASTVRITNVGPDGDANYDAFHPAVAYNSTASEYVVVWAGTDDAGSLAPGETEIYGLRVDATTAQPIGSPVRISSMGTDGDETFAALHPTVVFNPVEEDYFVTWQGSATAGEFEIFGRRLNASDLSISAQERLTNVGADGDATVDAQSPAVAVDTNTGAYFVTWHANPDGDMEVYGRGLNVAGQPNGSTVLQISDAGPSGDSAWRATHPAVAFNSSANEFWIVWSGSDDQTGLVAGENEIFLRRLESNGTLIGTDGQRISAAGADGDASIDAERPTIVMDSSVGEAFVSWSSNAADGSGAFDVYGQRLDLATASEKGTDDLRLSTMGPSGDVAFSGFAPAIAGISGREYVVAWRGDDSVDNSFEVHLQRVYADLAKGDEGGDDDALITSLSDGTSNYGAVTTAIAAGPSNSYLVVWSGDTSGSTLVEGEHEIFGQILKLGEPLPVDLASFTAAPSGDGIELSWQTLSETNNDRFEVQRRAGDAAKQSGTWQTVGTVSGAGTTTEAQDYRFLDRDLPYVADEVVYRLQQVDVDGASSLSDEIRIDRSGVTRLELLATFPNPARTATTVQYAVPESVDRSTDVRLMLYDVLGRQVRDVRIGSARGRNEVRMRLDGLASGMYFLRLEAGGQVRTQKLTVVR
ncbi:hypothetical protein CRI94_15765 [Longibacter salinarum]|uniref:Secretion system C-terminal sorting domain-containing protein n=1 Tax=Longibacter salinarum TaxID=1850348 RepID=A0A2A8CUD7_9BACT|nr:T9SS type A sorting domain-containing protein [Longibacter salinarum]PEN11488.1 hypothetical protein CRI94_15765 [Longibacter salinarum]